MPILCAVATIEGAPRSIARRGNTVLSDWAGASAIVRGAFSSSLSEAVSTTQGLLGPSAVFGNRYDRWADSSLVVCGLYPSAIEVTRVNVLKVEPTCRYASAGMLNCDFLLNGTDASIASTWPLRGSIETSAAAGAPLQFIIVRRVV